MNVFPTKVYVLYSSWPTYSSDPDYMFDERIEWFVYDEEKAKEWTFNACKPEEDRWYEEVVELGKEWV